MMKYYAVWGLVGLLLGVGVGYGASRTTFLVGGEYFVPNNSERPEIYVEHSSSGEEERQRARVEVVNGERHQFGTMNRGAKKSHVFLFKNTGNVPLTLELGETTCKCTLGKLVDNQVLPGETAEVKLEWEGKASSTEFSQTAQIITNDPQRRLVRLTIEGLLEDAVRVMPERVHMPNVAAGTETKRVIRLLSSDAETPLEIEGHSFLREDLAEHFDVAWRPLESSELKAGPRAASGAEVTLTVKPGIPTGNVEQVLHLNLNIADRPELDIPISGNVVGDISIVGRGTPYDSERNLLTMGAVSRENGAKRELIILVKGERREEIQLEVDRTDPEDVLKATLGEPIVSERNVRYPLHVEIVPGMPPVNRLGNEQAKVARIYLKSTNSASDEVIIYVSFLTN